MSGNVVAWVYSNYPVMTAGDRTRKIVLSEVAEAANRDYENAHPGVKRIATDWHLGRSTVIQALSELVSDGWLEVTEDGRGRNATVYRVCREKVQPLDISEGPIEGPETTKGPAITPERSRDSDAKVQIPVSAPITSSNSSPELHTQQAAPDLLVFEAWKQAAGRNGKTVFSDARRRVVTKALKDYPLEDVIDAVRGWRKSDFHAGNNERRAVYNDLELLLRDAKHIEQFRDLERGVGPAPEDPIMAHIRKQRELEGRA